MALGFQLVPLASQLQVGQVHALTRMLICKERLKMRLPSTVTNRIFAAHRSRELSF